MIKQRIAFAGVGNEHLKIVKFIHQIPEYEISLVADENSTSEGMKFAVEKQIPVTTNLNEVLRTANVDVIAVLYPGTELYNHFVSSARPSQTVINSDHLMFIYDFVSSMINSKYLDIENKFGTNIKDISRAINDFGLITKNIDILAINASIEAARAGESGKGFAVVAANIKELVKNSRELLGHVKNIIDKLQITQQSMETFRETIFEKQDDQDN